MATEKNGHAVDSAGNAVADPSINVGALVTAEGKRQDDLRLAEAHRQDDLRLAAEKLADINNLHAKEIAVLRDAHATAMAGKESSRVDSLRQGDREETTRATVAAQTNIATLATTTTDIATTLEKKVSDTASAAEQRNSAVNTDVNKRLSALELASSEGKGKQGVSDPANERLALAVEKLVGAQQTGTGKGQGIALVVAIIVTGISVVGGLVAIAVAGITLVIFLNRAPQQSPVYVSPPATTNAPPPVPR